jgi:ABC-type transport system involved in multi-copper enzyme maturation permease subunit
MGVYRGGYRQYSGEYLPIRSRFLVIASAEFQAMWKGRWNRRLFLLATIPLIVTVAAMLGKGMVESKVGAIPIRLNLLGKLMQVEMLVTALLGASAGAGILAGDKTGNALVLYLARPLTAGRYLLGKGLALAAVFSITYLVPAMVFVGASYMVSSDMTLGTFALQEAKVLFAAGFNVAVLTTMVMLFSAVGSRSRTIGMAWFALYFFSQLVSKGALEATGMEWTRWLSVPDLLQSGLEWCLDPTLETIAPFLVLLGLGCSSVAGLWYIMVRKQQHKAVGA